MKTDIVREDGGQSAVYSKYAFDGYDYKGDPIFRGDEGECLDYCEANGHTHRLRRRAALVAPKFVKDAERRADDAVGKIRDLGLAVRSNVTYRASAAWKEQPTHYAYIGDFGSVAVLEWRAGISPDMKDFDVANGWLRELFGMATALWELGFTLTFDKDGKHTIFGNYPQWVTLDEEE